MMGELQTKIGRRRKGWIWVRRGNLYMQMMLSNHGVNGREGEGGGGNW